MPGRRNLTVEGGSGGVIRHTEALVLLGPEPIRKPAAGQLDVGAGDRLVTAEAPAITSACTLMTIVHATKKYAASTLPW